MPDQSIDPLQFVLDQGNEPLSANRDPVGFIFLPIIISAVLTWIVGRCLDRVFLSKANSPGILDRWRLTRLCHKAAGLVELPDGTKLNAAEREQLADRAHALLLAAGRSATKPHIDALKQFVPKCNIPFEMR